MKIELICTGDEVLSGATVNTNFSHISQKLGDVGFSVRWGTTVGDERETLLEAFSRAGERADAVIVNGGLGPTVDDLSQEVAAKAAGVELIFNEAWFDRMSAYFERRARIMPARNRKQAMLPAGAHVLDNPIGTACGFTMDIGRARFFFTPGVPREMHRMLDEQVIPRLLASSGKPAASVLKRFHSFGLGESRVDEMLAGIEALAPDGTVKLGFRAHYPQLETKLNVRGADLAEVQRHLAPVEAEVRRRLGNFVLAEDDGKLEGVLLDALRSKQGSLATVEMFTGGAIAARLAPLPGAESIFRRGIVARTLGEVRAALGLAIEEGGPTVNPAHAETIARAAREWAHASHGLAVLTEIDEGADRIEFGGTICIAIADAQAVVSRSARLLGGREWVRLGAAELGLDCLRRHLADLPVGERIDFEKI